MVDTVGWREAPASASPQWWAATWNCKSMYPPSSALTFVRTLCHSNENEARGSPWAFLSKNCRVFYPFSNERRHRKYKIEQVGESRGLIHQRVLCPPPPLGHSWERWCELKGVHLLKAASQLPQFWPVGFKWALWMSWGGLPLYWAVV